MEYHIELLLKEYKSADETDRMTLFTDLCTRYALEKSKNHVLMQKVVDFQDAELERDIQAYVMNENVQRL